METAESKPEFGPEDYAKAKAFFAKDVSVPYLDEILSALSLASKAAPSGGAVIDKDYMDYLVDRFLGWPLPKTFNPDGGISFKRHFNEHTAHPMEHKPSGTNLLTAVETRTMLEYLLDGFALHNAAALERAASPLAGEGVPGGWKLVPESPTGEMVAVGCSALSPWVAPAMHAADAYAAMLAAAPSPPPAQVEDREKEHDPFPSEPCVYSDRELLELFQMLLRSQIREERINSIEELHGLLRHVNKALAAAPSPAPASPPSPPLPDTEKPEPVADDREKADSIADTLAKIIALATGDPVAADAVMKVAPNAIEAALTAARRDAVEQAAKVADEYAKGHPTDAVGTALNIAADIRNGAP